MIRVPGHPCSPRGVGHPPTRVGNEAGQRSKSSWVVADNFDEREMITCLNKARGFPSTRRLQGAARCSYHVYYVNIADNVMERLRASAYRHDYLDRNNALLSHMLR